MYAYYFGNPILSNHIDEIFIQYPSGTDDGGWKSLDKRVRWQYEYINKEWAPDETQETNWKPEDAADRVKTKSVSGAAFALDASAGWSRDEIMGCCTRNNNKTFCCTCYCGKSKKHVKERRRPNDEFGEERREWTDREQLQLDFIDEYCREKEYDLATNLRNYVDLKKNEIWSDELIHSILKDIKENQTTYRIVKKGSTCFYLTFHIVTLFTILICAIMRRSLISLLYIWFVLKYLRTGTEVVSKRNRQQFKEVAKG